MMRHCVSIDKAFICLQLLIFIALNEYDTCLCYYLMKNNKESNIKSFSREYDIILSFISDNCSS